MRSIDNITIKRFRTTRVPGCPKIPKYVKGPSSQKPRFYPPSDTESSNSPHSNRTLKIKLPFPKFKKPETLKIPASILPTADNLNHVANLQIKVTSLENHFQARQDDLTSVTKILAVREQLVQSDADHRSVVTQAEREKIDLVATVQSRDEEMGKINKELESCKLHIQFLKQSKDQPTKVYVHNTFHAPGPSIPPRNNLKAVNFHTLCTLTLHIFN
ncbi:unnamed protein product [Allacma fusca]|uniref:Uncharacterized protein n=1 Tax=Allacma fusca TaxID=39272 RepID=A0A8J2JNH2_9HEXA|nr:unnamed protein product [Allacma fusca]